MKDQTSQGPRVFIRSKATCAAPLCEVLTPCRGLRPHHLQKDAIGMVRVACSTGVGARLPTVTITSGASATNSAACRRMDSASSPAKGRDRNGAGRLQHRRWRKTANGYNHVGRQRDQFGRMSADGFRVATGRAIFNRQGCALRPTKMPQALLENRLARLDLW